MASRIEELLNAAIDGGKIDFEPRSRAEKYLKAVVNKSGTEGLPTPISRIDALYFKLAETAPLSYEAGKQSAYDEFWDTYQKNGERTSYQGAFQNAFWNEDTFKPKYDMNVTGDCQYMFRASAMNIDLVEYLEKLGVTLSFSGKKSSDFMYTFSSTNFTRIGVVDVSGVKNVNQCFFYSSYLETIDEVIIAETVNPTEYMFQYCSALKNIKFTGTIGKSIYFSQSPLTVDSMKSVISALKNYAGTDNELKYTVKFKANCWTALEASGAAPDGNTWKEYVANLGWNT